MRLFHLLALTQALFATAALAAPGFVVYQHPDPVLKQKGVAARIQMRDGKPQIFAHGRHLYIATEFGALEHMTWISSSTKVGRFRIYESAASAAERIKNGESISLRNCLSYKPDKNRAKVKVDDDSQIAYYRLGPAKCGLLTSTPIEYANENDYQFVAPETASVGFLEDTSRDHNVPMRD